MEAAARVTVRPELAVLATALAEMAFWAVLLIIPAAAAEVARQLPRSAPALTSRLVARAAARAIPAAVLRLPPAGLPEVLAVATNLPAAAARQALTQAVRALAQGGPRAPGRTAPALPIFLAAGLPPVLQATATRPAMAKEPMGRAGLRAVMREIPTGETALTVRVPTPVAAAAAP